MPPSGLRPSGSFEGPWVASFPGCLGKRWHFVPKFTKPTKVAVTEIISPLVFQGLFFVQCCGFGIEFDRQQNLKLIFMNFSYWLNFTRWQFVSSSHRNFADVFFLADVCLNRYLLYIQIMVRKEGAWKYRCSANLAGDNEKGRQLSHSPWHC